VGTIPSIYAAGIGRFITGIASTVPSVVVAGSVEDMFDIKARVWLVLVWNAATTAGLVFGPIYGSYIAFALKWWVSIIVAENKLTSIPKGAGFST